MIRSLFDAPTRTGLLIRICSLLVLIALALLANKAATAQTKQEDASYPMSTVWQDVLGEQVIDNDRVLLDPDFNTQQIQAFLDTQPGLLKTYKASFSGRADEQQYSAAELIQLVSAGERYNASTKVLITLLEMKSKQVSDAHTTSANREQPFGRLIDADRSKYVIGFSNQLGYIAYQIYQKFNTEVTNKKITFSDGSRINTASDTEPGTYAIQAILAVIFTRAEWERVISDRTFQQTYIKLFNEDPTKKVTAPSSPTSPFLSRPYQGSPQLNSFFDHQVPLYRQDGFIVRYDGQRLSDPPNVGCTFNYNCYDGHDGIDFNVTGSVYAAAGGTITVYRNYYDGSGCQVPYTLVNGIIINHGNGYQTKYWHFASVPSNLNTGNTVVTGQYLGPSGTTGCSTGVHLHFGVIKSTGIVTDPYGWNGSYTDPWLADSRGTSSECLWNDGTCGGAPPTNTPTTRPNASNTPTTPPQATNTPNPNGSFTLISPSYNLQPNQSVQVSVRLHSNSYTFLESRGDHLYGYDNTYGAWPVQSIRGTVGPGQDFDFTFTMTSPGSSGTYQSHWQMKVGGNQIGPVSTVTLNVGSGPPTATPIPAGSWHVEYFSDQNLGSRCYDAYESTTFVFKDWGWSQSPAGGCPAEHFSARFTRQVNFPGGSYIFHAEHNDGARVYIDGTRIIDAWWDAPGGDPQGHDWTLNLSGTHTVTVEYYENTGLARIEAWWRGPGFLPNNDPGDPNQWRADYYGIRAQWGTSALSLNDGSGAIDHDWGYGPPGFGLPQDNFVVRFQRTMNWSCGRYQFHVISDDGSQLNVNNQQLLDQWNGIVDWTGQINLAGGAIPITLIYNEGGGSASVHMDWQQVGACTATPGPLTNTPTSTPISDNTPPNVNWTAPTTNGQVYTALNGVIQLAVTATDASGVRSVNFNRWDALNQQTIDLGTDLSAPYTASLDVGTLNMGWNEVIADATDNAGNVGRGFIWVNRSANGGSTATATPLPGATATATPGGGTCATMTDYRISQLAGQRGIVGTTDIGNHCDDCVTTVQLPFPYTLYGQTVSQVNVSSNGVLELGTAPDFDNSCATRSSLNTAILAAWTDLDTRNITNTGDGIFTVVSGSAPHRIFGIEWRAHLYNGGPVNFEILLYEGQNAFNLVYGTMTGNGSTATVGVQNADGSHRTQFECHTGGLSSGTKLVFTTSFTDIGGDVFQPFIENLYCRGIVEGYDDGTFQTATLANRRMLARWIVRARGWAMDTTGGPHFTDVPPSDANYPSIETAYNHGVISGYDDHTFRPTNNLTRGQMSKMIVIAMGWPIVTSGGPHFTDVGTSNVFYGQIETIVNHGLVSGYDCGSNATEPCDSANRRYFRYGNSLSRGQLSKVLSLAISP